MSANRCREKNVFAARVVDQLRRHDVTISYTLYITLYTIHIINPGGPHKIILWATLGPRALSLKHVFKKIYKYINLSSLQ